MKNKCQCGGTINWKVINGPLGSSMHKGLCKECNSIYTDDETPDHKLGKRLAHDMGVVDWENKSLLNHNTDTQIGYFRAIQHCATCKNAIGEPCTCVDCDCIYCKNKLHEERAL